MSETNWREKILTPHNSGVVLLFHTGHVMRMFDRSRRTIYHWLETGYLQGKQESPYSPWYFTLEEINRVRARKFMPELTRAEAIEFWREWDGEDA